ncbi:MAG TPA: sterol desaturase family protein [Bacteroidia bacterium]|nr:sterol desaturase family protein [Bacteroidia bacterium]
MAKNFISNKDHTERMFRSDLLEALSRIHFSVPLFIYVPVIIYFTYTAIIQYNISFVPFLVYFIAGVFIWTLTEYLLHRFVFHWEPPGKLGKRIHFIFHGVHHDYPSDSKRLVMVPTVSIPLAVLFYFIFYKILGEQSVAPFFSGFLCGYLFYDMCHYAIHHYNFKSKFWLKLKQHHMLHHFGDMQRGFGVSSTFWDLVFRTKFIKQRKEQSGW